MEEQLVGGLIWLYRDCSDIIPFIYLELFSDISLEKVIQTFVVNLYGGT